MTGHEDAVLCCALSPDATTVVSGSRDHVVKMWNAELGRIKENLKGHTGNVNCCAFSPDGQVIATGSDDETLRLWRQDGPTASLQGHSNWVVCCAFSPDGARLLSGSFDMTMRLWSVADGQPLSTIRGHADTVWGCAWSPDGALIASASDDETVRLWNSCDGSQARLLRGHFCQVFSVAFSPDGFTLASGGNNGAVKLWSVPDGKVLSTFQAHACAVRCLRFSADGTMLVTASDDRTVKLWSTIDGKLLATLSGHELAVTGCALSADGKKFVSSSYDSTVRLWTLSGDGDDSVLSRAWQRGVVLERTSGPLTAAASWRSTLCEIAAIVGTRSAQSAAMNKEIEELRYGAGAAAVEKQRRRVEELERALDEERKVLSQLEESHRRDMEGEKDLDRKVQAASKAARDASEMEAKVREKLRQVAEREAQLRHALSSRAVASLAQADASGLLRDIGLARCADVLAAKGLAGLSFDDMQRVGLDFAERKRLQRAVALVAACGRPRLTRPAVELAAGAAPAEQRPSVLSAAWTAAEVAAWLESSGVAPEVRDQVAAAGVTGEQLMHVEDADLVAFKVEDAAVRQRVVQLASALRDAHYAAVSQAFAGAPEDACPLTMRAIAEPVLASDGVVYEANAIRAWFAASSVSPVTGATLEDKTLVPAQKLSAL
eukprot:m51a1_g1437 putative wd-40 repeat-containing protein (662) ;mRNA; f:112078-114801